jgi:hypothetical protein
LLQVISGQGEGVRLKPMDSTHSLHNFSLTRGTTLNQVTSVLKKILAGEINQDQAEDELALPKQEWNLVKVLKRDGIVDGGFPSSALNFPSFSTSTPRVFFSPFPTIRCPGFPLEFLIFHLKSYSRSSFFVSPLNFYSRSIFSLSHDFPSENLLRESFFQVT